MVTLVLFVTNPHADWWVSVITVDLIGNDAKIIKKSWLPKRQYTDDTKGKRISDDAVRIFSW